MRTGLRKRPLVAILSALAAAGVAAPARAEAPEVSEAWVSHYDGGLNSQDSPHAVGVSPDGTRVYVAGMSYSRRAQGYLGDADVFVIAAYDASSGKTIWTRRRSGHAWTSAVKMVIDPAGEKIYMAGTDEAGGYLTVAYDAATGVQGWEAHYATGSAVSSLAVSADGSAVYVTGSGFTEDSPSGFATVAYTGDGVQKWASFYAGNHIEPWNGATAVAVDGDVVYVTGSITTKVDCHGGDLCYAAQTYATVAYGAEDGLQKWSASEDADIEGYSNALGVDGEQVYVTGAGWNADTGWDYVTVAYRKDNGAKLWTSRYDAGSVSDDWPSSLATDGKGGVFVTGASTDRDAAGLLTWHDATVAYSAAGNQAWVSHFGDPSASSQATALSLSPDGETLFVAGGSDSATQLWDFATTAYDADTGDEIWSSRYDNSVRARDAKDLDHFNDSASALAVGPDGSVYVTGESSEAVLTLRTKDSGDWTTVAYRAGTCASGANEDGQISGPVHHTVEPVSSPTGRFVHRVNCRKVVARGL